MNATSQKRPTRKGGGVSRTSVQQQLEAIQQTLAEMKRELSQPSRANITLSPARPSTDVTRYLSECETANYMLTKSSLNGADDTIAFCNQHFRSLIDHSLQEEMHLLTLNGANRVIRSHQITVGLLNSAPVHPREIFRPAILDAAAAIILVHNHPSGSCKPSTEDLKVTNSVEEAAKLMGIKLLDHIVVARDRSVSLFEWRDGKRPLIG